MRQQRQRCVYCNEPATLLCDFRLGSPMGELVRNRDGSTWRAIDATKPPYTCDMPICREHAEHRGSMHIRFSRRVNGSRGMFDTVDYCPEHAGQSDVGAGPVEESEAERLRRAVHAIAQRRVMRERGVLLPPPRSPEHGELF